MKFIPAQENPTTKQVNGWTAVPVYDESRINNFVDETGTRHYDDVTSIPSPLARMVISQDAFNYVRSYSEVKVKEKQDNFAVYDKIVSRILDIWELMYNHANHKNNLQFDVWNIKTEVENLKNSSNPKHKQLYKVFDLFLISDNYLPLDIFPEITVISYDDYVLGGTSPFTGFYLSAAPLPQNLKSNKGIALFGEKPTPLKDRDPKFVEHLYKYVWAANRAFGEMVALKPLRDYLSDYFERNKSAIQNTDLRERIQQAIDNPVTCEALDAENERIEAKQPSKPIVLFEDINKTRLFLLAPKVSFNAKDSDMVLCPQKPCSTDKLPLILSKHYHPVTQMQYTTNIAWKDVINEIKIPLKPDADINKRVLPNTNYTYPYLTESDFFEDTLVELPVPIDEKQYITGKLEGDGIKGGLQFLLPIKPLYLEYFNEDELVENLTIKHNKSTVDFELRIPIQKGQSVTLKKMYQMEKPAEESLTGYVVPVQVNFYASPYYDTKDIAPYHRIFLYQDVDTKNNTNCTLEFLNNKAEPITTAEELERTGRSKTSQASYKTKHYTVREHYRTIRVKLSLKGTEFPVYGLVVPKWIPMDFDTETKYKVVVDLGTTNTHFAIAKEGADATTPLYSNNLYFNSLLYDTIQHEINKTSYERVVAEFTPPNVFDTSNKEFSHQFPSPFRTILAEGAECVGDEKRKIGARNIWFGYGKYTEDAEKTTKYYENIKWDIKEGAVSRLESYIDNLLFTIRLRLLMAKARPTDTTLIWTYPLSMSPYQRENLKKIWAKKSEEILGIKYIDKQVAARSESEGPYYYFLRKQHITLEGARPTLIIDIGGGTVDFMVIYNKKYKGGSAEIGGNWLFNPREESAQNPLTKSIIFEINKRATSIADDDKYKKVIDAGIKNIGERSNEQVINYCFTHNKSFKFTEEILNHDEKFRFITLFYFAAQNYYGALLIQAMGCNQPPSDICFSGNGTKLLEILSTFSADSPLVQFLRILFAKAFNTGRERITPHKAENPKAVTSEGLAIANEKQYIDTFDLDTNCVIGLKLPTNTAQPAYKDIKIEGLNNTYLKDTEFGAFLQYFFEIDKDFSYEKNLGIGKIKLAEIADYLQNADLCHFLRLHIERKTSDDPNKKVEEALFFQPVLKVIDLLIDKFYSNAVPNAQTPKDAEAQATTDPTPEPPKPKEPPQQATIGIQDIENGILNINAKPALFRATRIGDRSFYRLNFISTEDNKDIVKKYHNKDNLWLFVDVPFNPETDSFTQIEEGKAQYDLETETWKITSAVNFITSN